MASITASPIFDRLDRTAILARVEGDEELLEEIVQLFIEDCPRLLAQMKECLSKGDAAGVRMAAHTLKGSLSYFGPLKACGLASDLEITSRDGNLEQAGPICEALVARINQMQPYLVGLVRNPGRLS